MACASPLHLTLTLIETLESDLVSVAEQGQEAAEAFSQAGLGPAVLRLGRGGLHTGECTEM